MKKILFFGDSVTDAGRLNDGYGKGYVNLIKNEFDMRFPNEYEIINRGVGGNKITHLMNRKEEDLFRISPDIVTILVGVNDVWFGIMKNWGTTNENYRLEYSNLIDEIKGRLPKTKIIIMEPFAFLGAKTENTPEYPDRYTLVINELLEKANIAKNIAKKNSIQFIKLWDVFKEANKKYPLAELFEDGIHPTLFGHSIIKDEWLKTFDRIIME